MHLLGQLLQPAGAGLQAQARQLLHIGLHALSALRRLRRTALRTFFRPPRASQAPEASGGEREPPSFRSILAPRERDASYKLIVPYTIYHIPYILYKLDYLDYI